MSILQEFKEELQNRVSARDKTGVVNIFSTPATTLTGEYLVVIDSDSSVEKYAFNPSARKWCVVYDI